MNSFKRIIAILALFSLTVGLASAANVIVVTHGDTQTTFNSISAAFAAETNGDTIDIQSFDGPLAMTTGDGFDSWSTLKCTAATPATIVANGYIGAMDHITVSNIIFDGQGTVANFFNGGTKSTFTNCTFKNTTWSSIFYANGTEEEGVTFSHCYFINYGHTSIGFTNNWNSVGMTNKAIIDHCTFVNAGPNGSSPINLDDKYAGKDMKLVFSLKNCIISNRSGATGITYGAGILTDAATQVDEDYNIFDAWWHPLYSEGNDAGMSDGVGAHSKKVDYRSSKEYFRNFAAGDYRLAPLSKLNGNAENDTNFGADQTNNGKITGDVNIVRQDGTGDYTNIQAALNASAAGDTVWITQGDTWALTEDLNIEVGRTLKGLLDNGKKATLSSSKDRIVTFFRGNLDSLILTGNGSQTGAACDGPVTIKNCDFVKLGTALTFFGMTEQYGAASGGVTSGTITDSTFLNSSVYFTYYRGGSDTTANALNPITFTHCTFDNQKGSGHATCVNFGSEFMAQFDASQVTFKNDIFRQEEWTLGIIQFGGTQTPALKVSYNDYFSVGGPWKRSLSNIHAVGADWAGDTLALGTGEVEGTDPAFRDAAKGDYRILTTSPVAAIGEAGTYLGAFAPVDTINAAKGWTMYN